MRPAQLCFILEMNYTTNLTGYLIQQIGRIQVNPGPNRREISDEGSILN